MNPHLPGWTRFVYGLLLCSTLGCSVNATIGGLCPEFCRADATDPACSDLACLPDAGKPSACAAANGCVPSKKPDACPGDGCAPDAGPSDAGSCSPGPVALTRKRLDMLMVVDDTASVFPWWGFLAEGLDQFLQDSASSGIGVGLQRFGDACDPRDYEQLLVPIAPLPGNTVALRQALPILLSATTSTIPSLAAALGHARAWESANSGSEAVVVLLTDASPGACDALNGDYEQEAARVARAGYEGTPSIPTYVVGVGSIAVSATLARSGGTEPAQISVTPQTGDVLAVLQKMRDGARPCSFGWPSGTTLVADSAVVVSDAGGSERRYDIQADATACDRQDGFYLEDPSAPFPLTACPRTCASIAGSSVALSDACAAP